MSILIIGGGAVTRDLHLPAFAALQLLPSLTIVEPNASYAAALRTAFGVEVIEQNFDTFFANLPKKYDFALITLPNKLHSPAIACCVQHKIPVLCEKPLTLSPAEAEQIAQLAQSTQIPVGVAMVRRFTPAFQAFRAFLPLVGKLLEVKVEDGSPYGWTADSPALIDKNNGGVCADMGIHFLDLLYAAFGTLQPLDYQDDSYGGVESNCNYQLQTTTDKISVHLILSRQYNLRNRFEAKGEQGTIWFNKNEFDCAYFEDKQGKITKLQRQNPFEVGNLPLTFASCFIEQIHNFQQAIRNKKPLQVAAIDALHTTELLAWAYKNRTEIPKKLHYQIGKSSHQYFITGGNGFIGSRLIDYLTADKNSVTAGVRSYRNALNIAKNDINIPRFDLLNEEDVKQKLQGHSHIIHLAYSSDKENAAKVNIEGTKNMVRAAQSVGAEAIVILSTMNVYGFPSGTVTEESPMNFAGGIYGETKKAMQEWCLNEAQKNNKTRIILLNPTCVYGIGGKTYTTLPLELAKNNGFCYIDEGRGVANVVYVDNLIEAIYLALHKPEAHAHNFIINDEPTTWRQFLGDLLLDYAKDTPNFTLSDLQLFHDQQFIGNKQLVKGIIQSPELRALVSKHKQLTHLKSWLGKKLKPLLQKNAPATPQLFSILKQERTVEYAPPIWLNDLFGNTSSIFSSAKASKILGWQPRISYTTAMETTQAWLRAYYL